MNSTIPLLFLFLMVAMLIQCQPSKKAMQTAQNQYIEYCGACHGRNAEYLKAKDKWMFQKDYPTIYKVIKEGIPSVKMPPYEKTLSDKEIQNIAKFVMMKMEES